jgi:hypothetical protein
MYQWLIQNAVLLGAAAAVLYIVERIWKPFSFCWARISRKRKNPDRSSSIDLRFVHIPRRCFWVMGNRGDRPVMQIVTEWHVTNISPSRMPIRLLTAHLLKPRVNDVDVYNAILSTSSSVGYIDNFENEIPAEQTSRVHIEFYIGLSPKSRSKAIKARIVVIDQLSNKHKLPVIRLLSFNASAGK